MLTPLVVALSLTTPAPVRADDPPVQVWIGPSGSLVQGDRVRVHVRTAQDAYVVVLRVDGEGRVRALFPLDPGEDDFVRGGRNVEVRGRSDREAFFVDEQNGTFGYGGYGYGGYGFGLGFGRPYYYCDPFFDAFCDSFSYGYGYDPFYYGGLGYGYCWWCVPRVFVYSPRFHGSSSHPGFLAR